MHKKFYEQLKCEFRTNIVNLHKSAKFRNKLTAFTVAFMKSFLSVKSKSGYFAYTCLHTVFMVISSRLALSKISLT